VIIFCLAGSSHVLLRRNETRVAYRDCAGIPANAHACQGDPAAEQSERNVPARAHGYGESSSACSRIFLPYVFQPLISFTLDIV